MPLDKSGELTEKDLKRGREAPPDLQTKEGGMMGWRTTRDFQKHQGRRADRYAQEGRKFEQQEMRKILQKMRDAGQICEFEIFAPNSPQDRDGKDIRISKMVGNQKVDNYFGVTISPRCWKDAQRFHPDTPQFCFPIGTKPETIQKRVLGLFEKQ